MINDWLIYKTVSSTMNSKMMVILVIPPLQSKRFLHFGYQISHLFLSLYSPIPPCSFLFHKCNFSLNFVLSCQCIIKLFWEFCQFVMSKCSQMNNWYSDFVDFNCFWVMILWLLVSSSFNICLEGCGYQKNVLYKIFYDLGKNYLSFWKNSISCFWF